MTDLDYVEPNNKEVTEQQEKEKETESADSAAVTAVLQDEDEQEPNIGKITFVSCATGSNHPVTDSSTNKGKFWCISICGLSIEINIVK